MNFILYAIPFFFLLIAIELVAERVRGTNYYRVNDAVTSLSTGTINQLVAVVQKLIPFTLYVIAYQQFALFELGDSAVVWLFAFVIYDFFYYWNHRCGHEINLLWASHVVHHSSEEYNLTTALRQTGTGFLSVLFYLPMAVLGFDPLMVVSVGALNLIYQFWVHTQHVSKLGWLEWVLVTPSNHRAHHAQNAVYIDRNYGGVFIIWDRLFGSYQEELEHDPPVFGIRGAVNSWNPLWANIQVYNQLLQDALHTKNWLYKMTIWFRRTGWRPPDVVQAYPLQKTDLDDFQKFDTTLPKYLKVYCLMQYTITSIIALGFALGAQNLSLQEQSIVVIFVLLSSFSVGAIMEHKHYAGVLEYMRLGILFVMAALSPISVFLSWGLCLACIISAPILWLGRNQALLPNAQQ